jgi:endonuclease-3
MNNKEIINTFMKIEEFSKKLNVPFVSLLAVKKHSPFHILVSAVLSSRTRDDTSAKVLPRLFSNIKNFEDILKIEQKKLEELIYPVGFYRTKAKNLKELSEIIIKKYDGNIPDKFEELIKLPGIGRKIANLILSEIFNKDEICVDTHVHRISNRIGWVKTKKPLETEIELKKIFPKNFWRRINKTLVAFGQGICKPKNPKCMVCPVKTRCPKIGVK